MSSEKNSCLPWKEAVEIVDSIQTPRIPEREFRITCSSGDDIRPALQNKISECAATGGGRVIIPSGIYRCNGPINLESFTELHLESGTVIKFSPEPSLYLPQVFTRWEGVEIYNYSPWIYGKDLTDVAITGKGVFTGGSEIFDAWRYKQKEAQMRSREAAEKGIPAEERIFGEKDFLRPAMFQLVSSKRILIEGITMMDAPFWMFQPLYCEHVTFRNVMCDSMHINNDGIDVDSCENVLIEDSVFRNGDDAVVIKSGRDQDGWRVGKPTRNVVIRNCKVPEALHGVAIGSELSGGAENIYIHNIEMGTVFYQAIQFKSNRDRGGVIKHVKVRDVTVKEVRENLVYFFSDYPDGRGGNTPTKYSDFEIENVFCEYASKTFHLQGSPEFPLENSRLKNITVKESGIAFSCREHIGNTELTGCQISGNPISV